MPSSLRINEFYLIILLLRKNLQYVLMLLENIVLDLSKFRKYTFNIDNSIKNFNIIDINVLII